MSPYNYCENNPIIFIDPDGQQIIISYQKYDNTKIEKEQPKPEEVIYKNGELFNTDGSEYKGNASKEADDYFNMVKQTIDDVRSTDERFETVIGFMENDKKNNTDVKHYVSNVVARLEGVKDLDSDFGKFRSINVDPPRGSASQVQKTNEPANSSSSLTEDEREARNRSLTIRFRPDEDIPVIEKEIGLETTAGTIFAHELKHFWNGRFGLKETQERYLNKFNLNFEEIDAVHFENIYRIRKGMNARIIYSLNYGGQQLDDDDIIDNLLENYKLSKFPLKNNNNQNLIQKK